MSRQFATKIWNWGNFDHFERAGMYQLSSLGILGFVPRERGTRIAFSRRWMVADCQRESYVQEFVFLNHHFRNKISRLYISSLHRKLNARWMDDFVGSIHNKSTCAADLMGEADAGTLDVRNPTWSILCDRVFNRNLIDIQTTETNFIASLEYRVDKSKLQQ